MKEFYIRTARVWVKVIRNADKSFSFVTGYTGEFTGLKTSTYGKDFMPTIADAKEHAAIIAADYK